MTSSREKAEAEYERIDVYFKETGKEVAYVSWGCQEHDGCLHKKSVRKAMWTDVDREIVISIIEEELKL